MTAETMIRLAQELHARRALGAAIEAQEHRSRQPRFHKWPASQRRAVLLMACDELEVRMRALDRMLDEIEAD
jgi:hypothetical protein